MSNDLENLSYDELAGKARGAGEATRDATVRTLANIIDELCRRLASTEKRLGKVEQRKEQLRGRLKALEDVIINAVPAQTLKPVLDQLEQNIPSRPTGGLYYDAGYSNETDRLKRLLTAKMSGQ